jgi:hypothetical protein
VIKADLAAGESLINEIEKGEAAARSTEIYDITERADRTE